MNRPEEKSLGLPGDRVLAFTDSGNATSSTVVIFFHGAFGVGDASRPSPVILNKNLHFITPTLPGWGNSSPIDHAVDYVSVFASDITALITHLHPDDSTLRLYICGGSFGTVHAQILHGLSYDVFPLGRHIIGLLLLAPLSPPHCHKDYAKGLTWPNYFMVGPPARHIPFNCVAHLGKLAIGRKMGSAAVAEVFIRETLFDQMDEGELESYAKWRSMRGLEDGQLQREMAENVVRSVAKTWDGYFSIPEIYHSGWGGVCPDKLDDEHAHRPVLIVASRADHLAPAYMADWLAKNYRNAKLKFIEGGHIAAIFHLDEIWDEFLSLEA